MVAYNAFPDFITPVSEWWGQRFPSFLVSPTFSNYLKVAVVSSVSWAFFIYLVILIILLFKNQFGFKSAIFRWFAFIPMSIITYILIYLACLSDLGRMFHIKFHPQTPLSIFWEAAFAFAAAAASAFMGIYTAPNKKTSCNRITIFMDYISFYTVEETIIFYIINDSNGGKYDRMDYCLFML